jgi:hypothetical protein
VSSTGNCEGGTFYAWHWCNRVSPRFKGRSGTVGVGQSQGSPAERWARLVVDVRCGLRRGAWYPVLSAGPEETVVVVRHRPVVLPHFYFEIVHTRPNQWTLVTRASGAPYAVCPRCAERVSLHRPPRMLRCTRCYETHEVEQADALALEGGVSDARTGTD